MSPLFPEESNSIYLPLKMSLTISRLTVVDMKKKTKTKETKKYIKEMNL